jgi:uncharacterized membrane protein
VVGVYIPLFILATYVLWKKVSKGQKINLVMALAMVFFGLSTISVSNLCDCTIRQSPGLINVGCSTGSLAFIG